MTAKKTKKRAKKVKPRKRRDAAEQLIDAAAKWVNQNGGNAVVGGDIGIMFTDREFTFYVCVKITGRAPEIKSED